MLNIIMFKNLGFERLRITSPCLYHTKVKQNNFKKTGGYDPSPPPPLGVGMDLAESNCRANLSIPGHQKKVRKKCEKSRQKRRHRLR